MPPATSPPGLSLVASGQEGFSSATPAPAGKKRPRHVGDCGYRERVTSELRHNPHRTNVQIAALVGCTGGYAAKLRKEMGIPRYIPRAPHAQKHGQNGRAHLPAGSADDEDSTRERRSWKQVAAEKAEACGMPVDDYTALADDLFRNYCERESELEGARAHARRVSGLTAGSIAQLENEGFDWGSDHARTRHLDAIGREIGAAHPSLAWPDDCDFGERIWNLIKSGSRPQPSKLDERFLSHVDAFLARQCTPAEAFA